MPESDADLLSAYAVHRDEAAFRVLAGRHLGLVFHSAMRRTGNRPLAEEISQNVLCALAAKAGSLARHSERLPAWLHRATLYESTKAMRSETSRRRREQLADLHGESSQGGALADALPHLDPALDKLGEADRRLLLLHYYERRSFPDIAGLLGKSTVAVQKQSQRALEKLARVLRGKGVTLTAIALASVLSGEFAKAAAPSLTSSVVAAVLANGGGSSTGLVLFMAMKSKALGPAILMIAAIPLILQEAAISQAEQRLHVVSPSVASVAPSKPRSSGGMAALSSISSSIDLMVLFDEQTIARFGGHVAHADFMEKLAALDEETLAKLIRETATCHVRLDRKGELLEFLVAALGKKDPGLAVTTAVDALAADTAFERLIESGKVREMLETWGWADADAAWDWFQKESSSGKLKGPFDRGRASFQIFRTNFVSRLLAPMIVAGSAGRDELMEFLPIGIRSIALVNAIEYAFRDGGGPVAERAVLFLPEIRKHAAERNVPGTLRKLANELTGESVDFEEATRFFRQAGATPQELEIMAGVVAASHLKTTQRSYDPDEERRLRGEVSRWLAEVAPEQAAQILGQAMKVQEQYEKTVAEGFLRSMQTVRKGGAVVTDESIARSLDRKFPGELLDRALGEAEKIQDPALKAETVRKLRLQALERGTTTTGP